MSSSPERDAPTERPSVNDSPQGRSLDLVAVTNGQDHTLDANRPLSDVVETFDAHLDAIGVMVTDNGHFVAALSRESIARFLSKPYTQFLYLHRPISHMLGAWTSPPLECANDMSISDVIVLALSRPVEDRYEPVVARGRDGIRRMVDVHSLLVEQNRSLQSALASLEQQRAATVEAERQREDLHARLVEASRNAGRAEVATGILHNVGNVLNSVSVSRAMIGRKLEQSKVGNLSKAASLLSEHRADLEAFLTHDRRGRELPGYFVKLADVLVAEHDFLRSEIKELGENLEHIKQVVATQQSYARARAVMQDVRPVELMDDAVRMNVISFERHNVTVERRYEDTGVAPMDRHRILQILINLISNAKNALKRAAGSDRRIILTVTRCCEGDAEWVRFVVEDNGVGISAENLTRVFAHGFTTRKDGHGFGLHTSANFARELGGSLTVASDGHGCGARFTLDLPVPQAVARGIAS